MPRATRRRGSTESDRPPQDAVDDRAPDPALSVVAAEAADERDTAPVDLVAEPREQRGKDGQRAEHRDRDHRDRRGGERREDLVTGQEHAGHGDDDGDAGDEHGTPGGRRGDLDGVPGATAGGTLLAFAPEVEERVVNADREPDQEHERARLHRRRHELARDGDEAEGREDRGQGEDQRNAGGHQRPEGDHEDDERDREGQDAGLAEVVVERGLDAPWPRWRPRTPR